MLRDRPVFIGVASGGVFTGDRANQPDFLTPYLSLALSSIGLKTQQFIPLEATAFLDREQAPLAREKALAALDLTVMGELRGVDGCPAVLSGTGRRRTRSSLRARRKRLARPHHNPPASAGL